MDTLGPAKSVHCPEYQGVLIFQVTLYEKVLYGTSTNCVDYAGVPILSSVHINRFHCIIILNVKITVLRTEFKNNAHGNSIHGTPC